MNLFDADIQLKDVGNSRFTGIVSDNWSVNGTPNGGYLMAMIASAMLRKSDKKGDAHGYRELCIPVRSRRGGDLGFRNRPVPAVHPV